MIKRYSNQNHAVHRKNSPFEKVASVYDKQSISNRISEEKSLGFSSLTPFETEAILSVIDKEAKALEAQEIEKRAAMSTASPFEHFKNAKNYISSKLGIADDSAHDLASSVVGRAEDLHQQVGGDLEQVIGGIIDNMDARDIQNRIGAISMRKASPNEIEDHVKMRLMEEMQLTSFQADQVTKSVLQQARNLSTRFRKQDNGQLANAILDVMINHQDVSIVYSISSSERLVEEVKSQLDSV